MIELGLGDREAIKIYKKLQYKENPLWKGLREKLEARLLAAGIISDKCSCCGQKLPRRDGILQLPRQLMGKDVVDFFKENELESIHPTGGRKAKPDVEIKIRAKKKTRTYTKKTPTKKVVKKKK